MTRLASSFLNSPSRQMLTRTDHVAAASSFPFLDVLLGAGEQVVGRRGYLQPWCLPHPASFPRTTVSHIIRETPPPFARITDETMQQERSICTCFSLHDDLDLAGFVRWIVPVRSICERLCVGADAGADLERALSVPLRSRWRCHRRLHRRSSGKRRSGMACYSGKGWVLRGPGPLANVALVPCRDSLPMEPQPAGQLSPSLSSHRHRTPFAPDCGSIR